MLGSYEDFPSFRRVGATSGGTGISAFRDLLVFFSGRQGAEEELLSPRPPYVRLWVWWKFDSEYENFPGLFPCKALISTAWHFQPLCWRNLYALNAKRMKTVMQRLIHLIPFFFSFFFTCKEPYLMKFSPQCSRNCLHFLTIFVCRWKSRGGWCKCKVSSDSAMEKERKEGEKYK